MRGEKTYEGINGRVIDMTVDIKKADCGHFTMHFAKDEIHETNVSYTPGTQMLEIDRTFAGWIRDTNCVRKVKIKNGNGLSKFDQSEHMTYMFRSYFSTSSSTHPSVSNTIS